MNKFFCTKTFDLGSLLALISKGEIQLPDFQREFDWPYQKRKQLVQSLQKGFPTGTLLFLEVDQDPSFSFRRVENTKSEGKPTWLALDGQQRLSTISQVFLEQQTSDFVFYLKIKKLFEKCSPDTYDIDLDDEGIIDVLRKKEARNYHSALLDNDLFQLSLVFENDKRLSILDDYAENLQRKGANQAFVSFIRKRFDNFLENIKKYEYPAVVINKEANLEVVSTIFTEINTMGQRLTSFDLCVAKFFKESRGEYHLRKFLKEKKEEMRDLRIVDDNGTAFLQTVALMAQKDNKKSKLSSSLSYDDLENHGENAVSALVDAADQLRSILSVEKISDLPYPPMIPALAICMSRFPKKVKEQPAVQKNIKKWILASGITQRYVEGADVVQKKDLTEVLPWVLGGGQEPSFVSEPWTLNDEFLKTSANSARGKVLMLLLRLLKATDNDFFDVKDSEFESHHIFPKRFLSSSGKKESEIDLFLNRTIITKKTNSSISSKSPSAYLAEMKKQRFPGAKEREANEKMQHILDKHLINQEAYIAMLNNDYEAFIANRALSLAEYIEKEFRFRFVKTKGPSGESVPLRDEDSIQDPQLAE